MWLGGSPRPSAVKPLLADTDRLAVATGIVNVWADPAELVAAEQAELVAEYPGRFMLGVGIGHPEATSDYTRPLKSMRDFLNGLDAALARAASPRTAAWRRWARRCSTSSRERSAGTHPYANLARPTPAFARERLGAGSLVAPELACVLDPDRAALARPPHYAAVYLGLQNYTNNLLRFGFTERDIADGGRTV